MKSSRIGQRTDENSRVMNKLYGQLGMIADNAGGAYSGGSGFVLSDGSTTVALSDGAYAESCGARKYAEVAGYGMTHENVPYGEVKGSDRGLSGAINAAVNMAGISLSDIDAVYGFANGRKEVDDIEKNVYGELFGGKTPVHCIKEVTGEARAAASTLTVVHAALTLAGDITGSQKAYLVNRDGVEKIESDTTAYRYVLTTAYAVGGSYSAVVLKKTL